MTIDKYIQVFNVDIASYTIEDVEESIDRELVRQDRDGLSDGESMASSVEDASSSSLPNCEELEEFIRQEVAIATRQGFVEVVIEWHSDLAYALRCSERQVETDGDSATTDDDQAEEEGIVEARLQYQQEELKKEVQYFRDTIEELNQRLARVEELTLER